MLAASGVGGCALHAMSECASPSRVPIFICNPFAHERGLRTYESLHVAPHCCSDEDESVPCLHAPVIFAIVAMMYRAQTPNLKPYNPKAEPPALTFKAMHHQT